RPALAATVAAVAIAVGSWLAWKRATPRVNAEAARIVKSADFESPSNSQVRASIKRYEEAIRIDPTYAPAWAGVGTAHIALTRFGDVAGGDTLNEAKRASEEALRLGPSQSAAWRWLAWVSLYLEWDHPRAEERSLKAIAVDPQEPRALEWYTEFLMAL